MKKELRLELTDEPEVPEGFIPLIKFYVNDEKVLQSVSHKEIPKDVIIDILEQWIKDEKQTFNAAKKQ